MAGFLAAIPLIAGALGKVFGGAAGGKSDQRYQENQQLNLANRNTVDLYGTQQQAQNQAGQLDLQRQGFSEDARGGRAKQAIIGDILGRLQDVSINVPGIQTANVTGGLRPSAMGETGRAASGELAKQALMKLMAGDTFEGGKVLAPPTLAGMQQPSGFEKFLNLAGLVGSGIGGVGAVLKDLQKPKHSVLPGEDDGQ